MFRLINQDVHIEQLLDRIKDALKHRDAKAAIDHFSKVSVAEYSRLWKLLRLWSVSLIRVQDTAPMLAVKTLYDLYQLDPQKLFIERALAVIAWGNVAA